MQIALKSPNVCTETVNKAVYKSHKLHLKR